MSRDNLGRGYRRIHGELTSLGYTVAPSTIWKILFAACIGPAPDRHGQTWRTFPTAQAHTTLAAATAWTGCGREGVFRWEGGADRGPKSATFGWRPRGTPDAPSFSDGTGHVIGHWRTDLPVAGEAGVLPYIYVTSLDDTLRTAAEHGAELVTTPPARKETSG